MKLVIPLQGFWTVAQRELREAARGKGNRLVRFWSAVAGTLLLVLGFSFSGGAEDEVGAQVFYALQVMLVGLIFLIVPTLPADSLAREKRDGTLGLLFLTSLSAGGVVAGKAMTHVLRAFTLLLALVPMLVVPLLTGGITWLELLSALTLEFCVTMLCLAGGMLASSLVKNRMAAFFLAYTLAALLVYSVALAIFIGAACLARGWDLLEALVQVRYNFWDFATFDLDYLNRASSSVPIASRSGSVFSSFLMVACPAALLTALLTFGLVFRFAARRVDRSWRESVPTVRRERLRRRYCTPVFADLYRRAMRRSLERNPAAWLQQYSWKARLTKWGLCLLFIVVELLMLGAVDLFDFPMVQTVLLAILAGAYLVVSVNSFLEEKRSGALELILVTPLSINRLIFGRVWGLWKQFAPALLVVLVTVGFVANAHLWNLDDRPLICEPLMQVLLVCNFLTLPVFATCSALRNRNVVTAGLMTLLCAAVPLIVATWAAGMAWLMLSWDAGSFIILYMAIAVVSYAVLAWLECDALRLKLSLGMITR